jgi:HEAT repeat protein
MYLSYAAESGGDVAIPAILVRLRDHNPNTRHAAIYALGRTGSRAAVPLLINLLELQASPNEGDGKDIAISANVALRIVCHDLQARRVRCGRKASVGVRSKYEPVQ